ncbi:MAG: NAD(+) synthase, partial [Oscillospiraceae bacterium]|nr:NAD(+) synthase [Oscillospiraceae bacterium]
MITRNWQEEYDGRVAWIRDLVHSACAKGIVFGNSGGKDSALVGILCKAACDNTVGIIMPCASRRNFGSDAEDGRELARQYGIETRTVDLTAVRAAELEALQGVTDMTDLAVSNIAPRLRMTTLYAVAAAEGLLVA